jgi:hypothetical protein
MMDVLQGEVSFDVHRFGLQGWYLFHEAPDPWNDAPMSGWLNTVP